MPEPSTTPPPTRRVAAVIAAVALLAATAAGPPGDAPVASDPVFHALTADGKTVDGRIRQFGDGGGVTLVKTDGGEETIPAGSLVKLWREGAGPTLTPEIAAVVFPGGDRLYRTTIGEADETSLKLQSFSLGDLAVPLDSLLGLVLALPADPDSADALVENVRREPRTTEVFWLANGDRLTGGFLGLTDKTVEYQPGKEPVKLGRGSVVAIGFDPALVNYPAPESAFLELTFADGSRLGVTKPRVEQGHVLGTTRFGAGLKLPIGELVRVHARNASVQYLTERDPAGKAYVPYVGPPRPFRRDATVDGHPLRLAGQAFDRGLGTQSRTLIAYDVAKGDKRFQATVGLDDRAGPLGSAAFRVVVDGKEAFSSGPLTSHDPPRPVDVDLAGARRFVLITEFGERGGVRDLADWVEARIIR